MTFIVTHNLKFWCISPMNYNFDRSKYNSNLNIKGNKHDAFAERQIMKILQSCNYERCKRKIALFYIVIISNARSSFAA